MRDLTGHDRRPVSFLVYLWFAAEDARRKGPIAISYQEPAETIGISKSSAQLAVRWLKKTKAALRHQILFHYHPDLQGEFPMARRMEAGMNQRPDRGEAS